VTFLDGRRVDEATRLPIRGRSPQPSKRPFARIGVARKAGRLERGAAFGVERIRGCARREATERLARRGLARRSRMRVDQRLGHPIVSWMSADCPSQSSIWAVVIFHGAAFWVKLPTFHITRTS